ncbi:collagen-like protein [Gangjinia marincola]
MLIAMMAIAVSFTTTSCDAEDGEDGIDGVDGQQGPQGIPGEDGNANVISVVFNDVDISIGNNIIDIPEITQEVVDSGVVLGYVTCCGNDFWETLPLVISTEVRLDIDRIGLEYLRLVSTFNQTLNFRFIIIPSNVDTSGIDLNNFDEVSQHFGL